jgi:hypothetical protein
MTTPPLGLISIATVGLLVVAACTSDEAAAPTPVALAAASEAPVCAAGDTVLGDLPEWPLAGAADAQMLPVVMSSLVTVGPSRFLYNVLDPAYRQMAAPGIESHIDFYALERDPELPAASVDASYLSSGLGRGLYRAAVDFDCVGEWGAEISVQLEDGSTMDERLRFNVHAHGNTPGIGHPAPRSASLVAPTDEAAHLVSTDTNPYAAAYDKTVADTVTSGRPSLVFFATPAFCQTGFCGPTVELVKGVALEHEGRLEFVNVEPYELHMTDNGLQPLLDESGHLQPVQAALDYAIPIEPYLFLVDAEGNVFSKFEGVIGGDELRAAIEDVLVADMSLG